MLHDEKGGGSDSLVDLNRAGTPLLEIVSEPDMRSAEEAVTYAKTLHALVRWIGICDGNMQEGSFRCDANVSVRRAGDPRLGTRCEIKNLNSFRFLQHAIEFETRRQINLIEDGHGVVQETRLYDAEKGETRSMRSKEDAQDYRYFPDPDLPPLLFDEPWIERLKAELPELPEAKRERFVRDHLLSPSDAFTLSSTLQLAVPYEDALRTGADPRLAAHWIVGEYAAALHREEGELAAPVSGQQLGDLLKRIQDGTISGKIAKDVFDAMWAGEGNADSIIEQRGLRQISDAGAIEKVVDDVLTASPEIVAEYRAGKKKAFQALVGKVMAATAGKANPAQVTSTLTKKLSG